MVAIIFKNFLTLTTPIKIDVGVQEERKML